MNQIVAGHYTPETLQMACSLYTIEPSNAKLIRANANLIFDCGTCILRLSHSAIRHFSEIQLELKWLEQLHRQGLPVVRIVRSERGHLLEKFGATDYFTVVCFEKIIGRVPAAEDWNEAHFEKLGRLTGQLHTSSREVMINDLSAYNNWDEIPEHLCQDYLFGEGYDYRKLYNNVSKQLQMVSTQGFPAGLVHYDIHHGNYLLTEQSDQLVVFDFEMCCRAPLCFDVASVVYYAARHQAAEQSTNFMQLFLAAFKKGYALYRGVSDEEEACFPLYYLYRDLMVFGFVNRAWGDEENMDEGQLKFVRMLHTSVEERRLIL